MSLIHIGTPEDPEELKDIHAREAAKIAVQSDAPGFAAFTGGATVADVLAVLAQPRAELFARADRIRQQRMGDDVFLRGIVEFSNHCANDCIYCGIRRSNSSVRRYRVSDDEILSVAHRMKGFGQATIVLQSGELPSEANDRSIGQLCQRIKREVGLAITGSCGNRPRSTYAYWHECGMDRYLLRFESSDAALFSYLHPDCTLTERLRCLDDLRALNYQVGSGFMIGVPGETLEVLAQNILLCRKLDLDMIGCGPFIPHPETPLANARNAYDDDREMFFVAIAALRVFNPDAHIPATTAFDAVFPDRGRNLVLQRGANVFMPSNTPVAFRKEYLLYPNKPCVDESGDDCARCVQGRIASIGRRIGHGPGHSIKRHK